MRFLQLGLMLSLLYCGLLSGTAVAASLGAAGDLLGGLGDLLHQADSARERYDRNRSPAYEQEWRDSEYRLEESRIDALARETGIPRETLRAARADGASWNDLAKRYNAAPDRLGYGRHGGGSYNRDSDTELYRGYYGKHPHEAPPGLIKKGGMPPGQAKKYSNDDRYHKESQGSRGKSNNDGEQGNKGHGGKQDKKSRNEDSKHGKGKK